MYNEGHSQKNKTLPPGSFILGVKQHIPSVNERLTKVCNSTYFNFSVVNSVITLKKDVTQFISNLQIKHL